MAGADADLAIRVLLRGERNFRKAERGIARIGAASALAEKKFASMGASSNKLGKAMNRSMDKFRRVMDYWSKAVKGIGMIITKTLGMATKFFVAEFALMAASMIAVHALLGIGKWLLKGYHGAVKMVAGGAAAATAALAGLSAALREQQVAMWGYKGSVIGFKELGSNMASVRTVMRGLHRDSNLAAAGMANLNAAFAAVNQKSTFTAGSQAMLNQLMDFASAGQPLDKGMKAAGEFIGVLQDVESSWSEIKKAAEAMGDPAKKAIEEAGKAGISTAKGLMEAINSGQFALFGGVAGQWDNVNDTLISRFKATFTSLRSDFADLGDVFLSPIKDGLQHITNSFQRLFIRIRSDIGHFGAGPFVDTLVSAAEKLETGMARLIHHWLPMAQGLFDRIGGWWEGFTAGWHRLKANMEPLLRGALVLENMFMNIIKPVGDYLSNTFGSFSGLLEANKEQFLAFGTELGAVLTSMLSLQAFFKELLFESMPHFMLIMKGLRDIIGAVEGMLKGISGMMGGLGSGLAPFMMLMGMRTMGAGMRGTKGSIVSLPHKTQVMNVQSSQTTVTGGTTGATAGGQMGRGPYGQGGLYSQTGGAGKDAWGRPIPGSARAADPAAGGATRPPNNLAYRMAGGYNDPNAPHLGRIGRMQRAFGNMRNNTRMGQGVQRMQGSMGSKMGVGLGMGMLSQYAPEEMQGSLALGGMVGMFNPLAGLGVGLGGAALNSQSTAAGALAGGAAGAAIGTMIAPGVGTVVGGMIGAVAGGIMGSLGKQRALEKRVMESGENAAEQIYAAMIGGIDSVILEHGRSGMTAKRARTSMNLDNNKVKSIMTRLGQFEDYGAIGTPGTTYDERTPSDPFGYLPGKDFDLYQSGEPFQNALLDPTGGTNPFKTAEEWLEIQKRDMPALMGGSHGFEGGGLAADQDAAMHKLISDIVGQATIMGLTLSEDQIKEAYTEPEKFLEGMGPLADQFEAATIVVDKYEGRLGTWMDTLGLTEDEVLVLADAVGVNLYDAFEDFGEMTKDLAGGMIRTTEQMRGAWGNFLADEIVTPLQTFVAAAKAPSLINELGRGAREQFLAGEFDDAKAGELVISMVQALTDAGGAEYAALVIPQMFGADGMAFQKGSPLEGMEEFFAHLGPLLDASKPKQGDLQQDLLDSMLVGNLMGAGYGVAGVSAGDLHRALQDPATRDAFEEFIQDPNFGQTAGAGGGPAGQGGAIGFGETQRAGIEAFLHSIGLSGAVVSDFQTTAQLEVNAATVMGEAGGLMMRAAQMIIAHLGQGGGPVPQPQDTNQPIGDVGSTMGKTMTKYNMINGQLPGQRMITSGYRNYALGSVRSDHVMGRALDVVGSNLGGLANLTNSMGGFAEMHGSGKGRHLHMVPNAAEGDVMGTPGGGGSTTYNYNINVEGGPNADSGEVAELVMAAIQETARDVRERA